MTMHLPETAYRAIDEYLRLQQGPIVLSQAVAFVVARAGTDLAPVPLKEVIAESAIANGRAIDFDT